MGNFFKKILSRATQSRASNEKLIGTSSLNYLLSQLKRYFVEKSELLDCIYPVGTIIELKNDINPAVAIGGDWQDITSKYSGIPSSIKKWQRILKVDSDKSQLLKSYNQYKDLKQEDYTEASWPQFAEALAKAKEVLDDPGADQETVNKANSDLTVAFLMLRKKQ